MLIFRKASQGFAFSFMILINDPNWGSLQRMLLYQMFMGMGIVVFDHST